MAKTEQIQELMRLWIAIIATLSLSGCALFPSPDSSTGPLPDLKPSVVIPPPDIPVATVPAATVKPLVVTPAVITLPQVAIVVSSRHPAYEKVVLELEGQLDNFTVYDLSDKSQPPVTAFRKIHDSDTSAVVAVGLRAAISATSMSQVPVVFCQVFNIEQNNLLSDNSRGISSLPPLALQIAAWKELDPSLSSIGAIVGPGHDGLIAEAEIAAAEHGVELHFRVAKSDRETLYLFNRLVGEIDGFWLFPDNRILSSTVLKEMLSYASRHRVQISVFNESLLELGATLSSSTVDSDIADTIIDVLGQIASGNIDKVPPVSPLNDVQIVTNEALLRGMLETEEANLSEATAASGQ
jgi:ABC-type uncharacterized transport system substrate-binding protein